MGANGQHGQWRAEQQARSQKIDAIERAHRIVTAGRGQLESMCRDAGISAAGRSDDELRTRLLDRSG